MNFNFFIDVVEILNEIAEHCGIDTDDILDFEMTENEVSFRLKQPAERIEFTVLI